MSEETKAAPLKDFYDRDAYIAQWAKALKCEATVWGVACAQIKNRNFDTAMSLTFGLSWRYNKDWLRKCSDFFANYNKQCLAADPKWVFTPAILYQFQQYYLEKQDTYPKG
jgi:hypothetical protein